MAVDFHLRQKQWIFFFFNPKMYAWKFHNLFRSTENRTDNLRIMQITLNESKMSFFFMSRLCSSCELFLLEATMKLVVNLVKRNFLMWQITTCGWHLTRQTYFRDDEVRHVFELFWTSLTTIDLNIEMD